MALQPLPHPEFELDAPEHVAIIMDGNRRWARARGMPPAYGHRHGADSVKRAIEGCNELGIRYLTLYAFSSENWGRPANEVGELMNLLRFYIRKEIDSLDKNGIRVRAIGDRTELADDIQELVAAAEARTKGNTRLDLIVALNYGGRDELVRAARSLVEDALAGKIDASQVDHRTFSQRLFTADIPDPDLLIRTSGEQRISNFLLWQMAYTEFVFLPISWPEFTQEHLRLAVQDYAGRERRYGAQVG